VTLYAPALIACASTLLLSPLLRALLDRWQVRDEPTWRSSHTRPIARGGGIAVAIALTLALVASPEVGGGLLGAALLVGLGLGAVGLADDLRRGIPVWARLAATVVITAVGLAVLAADTAAGAVPVGLVALAWIVGYVNAFNFMDGIDGISSAQAAIGGIAVAVAAHAVGATDVAVVGLVVTGAALGFLPHNLPAARLFLGDVGSYLLGGVLALLVVAAIARGVPVEAASFAFLLYAADTGVTLARRMARGERWWEAHRGHAYQRLVDAGWSHAATTGLVAAVCAVTAGLGLVSLAAPLPGRVAAGAAAAVVVGGYLALPAWVAGRRRASVPPVPRVRVPT
jgi:UDP-GlcNAc:undecaprenyl-phosphate/decaprenyl-phosphate GlcNAc-1-phosphate transferase